MRLSSAQQPQTCQEPAPLILIGDAAAGPAIIQASIVQPGKLLHCLVSFLGGDTKVRNGEELLIHTL